MHRADLERPAEIGRAVFDRHFGRDELEPGIEEQEEDHKAAQNAAGDQLALAGNRSEEHTSELQSLMRISYAVFCFKKKTTIDRLSCTPSLLKPQQQSHTRHILLS